MRKYEDGGELTERMPEGDLPSGAKTFGEAFRRARADKASTFTWRGKEYSTELSSPSKTDTGDEIERMKARAPAPAARREPPPSRPAEVPRPIGEPGPEPIPPSRFGQAKTGLSDATQKALAATGIVTGSAAAASAAAAKLLKMKRARDAAKAARVREEPTVDLPPLPSARQSNYRSRTADRMDEREMGYKKGGVVKARGDGICQRGRTKGRMV